MGAQNKLFHRIIWLIDTVYSAGHIKMAEKICTLSFVPES